MEEKDAIVRDVLKKLHDAFESSAMVSSVDLSANYMEHDKLVGILNSLSSKSQICLSEPRTQVEWNVTEEGAKYCILGSPEFRLLQHVVSTPAPPTLQDITSTCAPEVADIGLKTALRLKWLNMDKATKTIGVAVTDVITVQDQCKQSLCLVTGTADEAALLQKLGGAGAGTKILQELKKRKLVDMKKIKFYDISKGSFFSQEIQKLATDLTQDMLLRGTWNQQEFKPYNFFAAGTRMTRGSIHPLMRVLRMFKKILFSLGFEEMPTQDWVESSFWNFDALFQPQQHPARDVQDTFFLKEPAFANPDKFPSDYVERVKATHEHGGGYGSRGWRYNWSHEEAAKNILRTHTTACSARMLYKVAQEFKKTGVFIPRRYFSIDRVFRNETLDATHLAEFHQVEGLVCDYGMSLANLMGILSTFYKQIGISGLRFKPAYNPYTEPSMEIFGFHEQLNKWIEVGNSGIFRPEMLEPMGFPPGISVIAWGLSLERPTMIRYNVKNIRELFGHKATLGMA